MKNLVWTSLALLAFLAAAPAVAQDLSFEEARKGRALPAGIWQLDGIDPELGTSDLGATAQEHDPGLGAGSPLSRSGGSAMGEGV